MKDKIVTIVLSIILFVVPVAIIPAAWGESIIVRLITLLVCGLVLLVITLLRIKELKFDIIDLPVLIFAGIAILSTIFSINVPQSIIGQPGRYEGLLTILSYVLIYYNSKYYFKAYQHFTKMITIIYSAICVLAIIQFYVGRNILLPPIFGSGACGTLGNQNFMGSFVSTILPVFMLGAIFRNKKRYYFASMLAFTALMMTLTRSAWVAFAISMLAIVIYLLIKKNKTYGKRLIVLILLFVICFTISNLLDYRKMILNRVLFASSEVETAIEEGLNNQMGSGRVAIWKMTIKLITKMPVLGCGVDNLRWGLQKECIKDLYDYYVEYKVLVDKAHNEYLQITATMGVFALLAYLTFVGMIVVNGAEKMMKHKVMAIFVIVILSYLAQAFFNISEIGVAPVFWFILGMAARRISRISSPVLVNTNKSATGVNGINFKKYL